MRRSIWVILALTALTVGTGCNQHSSSASTSPPVSSSSTTLPRTTVSSPASSAPKATTYDRSKDYGDGITLGTTCRDFIDQHASGDRYDAAIRMSMDFKVDSPGNPMWGMNMDAVCGSSPNMTLGDYFSRAGAR